MGFSQRLRVRVKCSSALIGYAPGSYFSSVEFFWSRLPTVFRRW